MAKLNITDFRIEPGTKDFNLEEFPTSLRVELYSGKKEYAKKLAEVKERMGELQESLYAAGNKSILFGIQAMDTGGKDGLIEHVFTGINPQGCKVTSFKRPTELELKQDFMWRHEMALPPAGTVGVWNRTHYEEVGAVRVHPSFLAGRGIEPSAAGKKFWEGRLERIRAWEKEQARNDRPVIKIFLNISKDEQARRLIARGETPAKWFKFSLGDLAERALWGHYMEVYSEAIAATSTKRSPWYVIPADDKRTARLIAAHIVQHHLEKLNPLPPKVSEAEQRKIAAAVRALKREL